MKKILAGSVRFGCISSIIAVRSTITVSDFYNKVNNAAVLNKLLPI